MSPVVFYFLAAVVKSAGIIFILLTGFAYTTLLERRWIAVLQQRVGPNRAGPFGFFQPVADGLKLFFKEDIVPAKADKVIFTLAPAITAIPALIVLAVMPIGPGEIHLFGFSTAFGLADINVAVLYILAVTSISVYGIVLAGWSSANKYAMMGGLRSSAQMISYELAMGLSILAPVMMVGSMSLDSIINAQKNVWFIFLQPIAGVIFYITILAETSRSPFDLPEAEQELTAGYHTEYSGMKFALFFMAEYIKMAVISGLAITFFFGGYREPLPLFVTQAIPVLSVDNTPWLGPIYFSLKVIFFLFIQIWVRATLPRFRYDKLMKFGWKVLLPLSLAWVMVTAFVVLIRG
jgi:NADH-quinone oxidoreductase subunit H